MILFRALCALGIDRTVWSPIVTGPGGAWSGPPVRVCRDCHQPVGRTHRE